VNRADLRAALAHPNVLAFNAVRDLGEHGPNADSPDRYRTMFGGEQFDAPPWEHPRRKITRNGITSTAAGGPQFLAGTWDDMVRAYGFEDFSPGCQEEAAVGLYARRGALEDIIAGRFEEAIRKCAKEWASLPGSPYGQPTLTMEAARDRYLERGGFLSAADPDAWQRDERYGDRVTESTTRPIPSADEQEAHNMAAPLIPIAIAAAQAFLPRLAELIPGLGAVLGSGSEVQKRNVAAAAMIADAVTKTVGEPNLQAAIEQIERDPAKLAEVRQVVSDILPTLVEAGGGGIKGAREHAEAQSGDWRKLIFSLPFVGIILFTPAIWAVVAASVFRADWLLVMDPQLRGTVIGFVMGTLAGSICGYVFGSSMSKAPAAQPLAAR